MMPVDPRRRAIGVREDLEESTSITSQVPPSSSSAETNDEAASSQPQSLIRSQNLVIADGQFNHVHGHHTNIVLNVNHSTSENTSTIQGSLSGFSNEADHISPSLPSSQSTQPNHERTSARTEMNQTIFTQKSNDIYERHLTPKGRGFPLWIPDPNENLHFDYRRTGVRIGDVGIITHSGGFSFLFNICLPHDHPVNPPTLPENFAPIYPPIEATDIENFLVFKHGSHLASASIKRSQSAAISGTGIVFESSASEGAILIMPQGARSEDLGNFARFREYAAANVADWYKFVNGPRGREAKNGDVRLVVGCDKTTSWGIATFANQTQQNSCRLRFGPSEGDSASTYTWSENSGVTDVRAGPDSDESDELRIDGDPPDVQFENQCLFVRTLNVTLTDDVWADIHSTLGSVHVDPRHVRDRSASDRPHSSSPYTGSGSNLAPSPGAQYGTQRATGSLRNVDLASDINPGMFISGPPGSLTAHPSKVLNDILLAKVPTAKMVITHDDDWSSAITQYDSTLPDPYDADFTANILASRRICEENGVIFLQLARERSLIRIKTRIYPTSIKPFQGKERERSPITCESCRSRELECYSLQLDAISPCERCVNEQLSCEYSSPGSSTLFLPTIPMQEVLNTIPKPKTYFTNFTVHAIRSITPPPFLKPAFTVFDSIWTLVKKAQTCQGQFTVLLSYTAAVLEALDMQYRTGQLNKESTWPHLQDLNSLLEGFATFVSSCSFLSPLFEKYQSLATIDVYESGIATLIRAFQISALVDIHDWQDEIKLARRVDQQYLRLRLEQIGGNQLLLAEALNVEKNNPIDMMAAFKRRIDEKRGEQEELTFFEQGFQYLLATSGQHVDYFKPWTISRFDVKFGEIIGVGAFGAVYTTLYSGTWDQREVALKVMKNTENIVPHPAVVSRELDILSMLQHPNILQFLGANLSDDEPFMVTPWIADGNVLDYIKNHPFCDILDIIEEIASGLVYLHSEYVIHGDLKGANVLIDDDGKALLCDFGLSRIKADVNSRSIAGSTLVGSLNWMAPELFKGEILQFPCDVYSFAMTMFEIFTKKTPLGHIAPDMLRKLVVDRNERPEKPSMIEAPQLSDRAWTVLQRCWQAEPSSRPTADAVHRVVSSPEFKVGSFNMIAGLPSRLRSNDDDLLGWKSREAPNLLQSFDGRVRTIPDLPPTFRPDIRHHSPKKASVNFTSQYPRGADTLVTFSQLRDEYLSKLGGTKNKPPSSSPVPLGSSYMSHAPATLSASYSSSRAVGVEGVVSEDYSEYINFDLEGAPTGDMQSLNFSPSDLRFS